ncbi:MAG: hypothetical protein ACQEV7_16365 [Bacillota bacterium]
MNPDKYINQVDNCTIAKAGTLPSYSYKDQLNFVSCRLDISLKALEAIYASTKESETREYCEKILKTLKGEI